MAPERAPPPHVTKRQIALPRGLVSPTSRVLGPTPQWLDIGIGRRALLKGFSTAEQTARPSHRFAAQSGEILGF